MNLNKHFHLFCFCNAIHTTASQLVLVSKGLARDSMTSLGDFTAVSGAVFWRALERTDDFGFLQAVPFVVVAGSEGVGTAMHHPSIETIGHRERFEMAS